MGKYLKRAAWLLLVAGLAALALLVLGLIAYKLMFLGLDALQTAIMENATSNYWKP